MHVGRIICHKDGLPSFIMGNHGLRARHDAAKHGDLALVHGLPAPVGDHVPIDVDELAHLGRYQYRHQCLGGTDALQVPQKLTQR
jgi:hypothetical protein